MATYGPQPVSTGSATAAGDLGSIGAGIVNNAGAGINPTNLAYGFYSVDASGRIWTIGAAISSAGYTVGSTKGILSLGVATAGATSIGGGVMYPYFLDLSGNLRVALTGNSLTAFISGTATVSGNVSATLITATNTIAVSATNTVTVSASNLLTVSAGVTGGSLGVTGGSLSAVTANQGTSPWVVSANNLLTVSAGVTGGSVGVTGGLTAVAAMTGIVSAQGRAGHGSATAGAPIRIGLEAANLTASVSTASGGSAVNWYGTQTGIPYMLGGAPGLTFKEFELSASTACFYVTSGGAAGRLYVTEAGFTYDALATANATFRMAFLSASAQTTLDAVLTATGQTQATIPILSHINCPPGAGLVRGNGVGIISVAPGTGCQIAVSAGAPGGKKFRFWVTYGSVPE